MESLLLNFALNSASCNGGWAGNSLYIVRRGKKIMLCFASACNFKLDRSRTFDLKLDVSASRLGLAKREVANVTGRKKEEMMMR
jgi:hypothetical protein